jgi:hypothetical protein
MIKSKVKIKVIKKNSVKIYKTPVVTEKNLQKRATGEMIEIISDWINDFQRLRSEETNQSFNRFFPRPQTDWV